MSDEVLVQVEGVSKKFCRSLKRSLWYGVQDVAAEMFGRKGSHDELRRNEFWAVNDVSIELKRGECLGLIGPNGAGKSTLLKMLNGLVKPDQGRITMRGRVGALIELGAGFNPILTARENIYVNGSVLGFTKKEIDRKFDAIVDFAEIEEFIDTPVQNYSSGMKVRLGFAVAAQMEPDVLLIDEVLAVGDAGFRAKCFSTIADLSSRSAVILVSHNMGDITRSCSTVSTLITGVMRCYVNSVPEGVSAYLAFIRPAVEKSLESQNNKLVSIDIESELPGNDNSIPTIHYLDELRLRIRFRLDPGTGDCIFNVNIHDESLTQVAQCASVKENFVVRGSELEQTVLVKVARLPLSLGRYTVSVYCVEKLEANRRGAVRFFRDHAAQFRVLDATPGYVSVHLPTTWICE